MDKVEIETKIKLELGGLLNMDAYKIKNEDTIESLGADSLDIVEATMALEEVFGIEIADADVEKFKNIQDAINYIDQKLGG